MKEYKAVFFDWDGTAVTQREAPVEEAARKMKALLKKGIKLAIISGTTMGNIGGGHLSEYFTVEERKNLFFGLGRGAYNYRFNDKGEEDIFANGIPDKETLQKIHRACYEVHEELLGRYGFPTDIVFSRPNYCKIDLMVEKTRGELLFFQADELLTVRKELADHGFQGGLQGLIHLAEEKGRKQGLSLSVTTDAKYLEVGLTSKSSNVDTLLSYFGENFGIRPEECAYWGDEYLGLEAGLFGSDSYMITDLSRAGDFFDVSDVSGERPKEVTVKGGGVESFLEFLEKLA